MKVSTFILLAFLLLFGSYLYSTKVTNRPPQINQIVEEKFKPTVESIDAQRKRGDLFNELEAREIFVQIRKGRVWVGPAFYSLEFEEKQNFILAVYEWSYIYGESDDSQVLIIDYETRNNIGLFSRTGLQLME